MPFFFNPSIPECVGAVCECIRKEGGRALLVGGCVRDLLLGSTPMEWDLEVFGLEASRLEELFAGRIDLVGKSFGIYHFRDLPIDLGLPRHEKCRGVGHRDFAVITDPHLPLATAARRRDFTVNAIYLDSLNGKLLDPVGGMGDLQEKCLRAVSEQFSEDPLRVLRAVQLAARLDFSCDDATLLLCQALSMESLSTERIFGEFRKLILRGKAIGKGLELLRRCRWLRFFPELEALCGCPQNPFFHPEGNVWEHIKAAMDVFGIVRPTEGKDALIVGFAVLCHDLGKTLCTTWDDHGQPRASGHELMGVEPTVSLLHRLGVPQRIVDGVLPLVNWHMAPRKFADQRFELAAVRRLAWNVGRLDRLLLVAHCDSWGRPPIVPDLSGEKRLCRLAEEEGLLRHPPMPLIRGRDLVERFSIQPSPLLGKILAQLFEDQLDGKFSTRKEGLVRAEEVIRALVSS